MTKARVLLAGLGVRGMHWARVIQQSERAEIVAFADPNPQACQRARDAFGEYESFESAEEALSKINDVDALVLANPPIGRESQIRASTERGIPMLVEKPLALDLTEARHFVEIAEAANVPLMVGLNFRYLGVTQATRTLLASREIGTPVFARFTYERYRDGNRPDLNKYPLEMDHPMLWEQSIHHFDLMRYVYEQEPVSVMCHTWNPPWSMYRSDTNVAALFKFDGGMVVNYQGTWQSNWAVPHFEWRTDCTAGVISQKEQFGELAYARHSDDHLTIVELPHHERWITETASLLETFLDTILDGKPLQCSGRDHLMSLAMVEACVVSSHEGNVVNIEDILQLKKT